MAFQSGEHRERTLGCFHLCYQKQQLKRSPEVLYHEQSRRYQVESKVVLVFQEFVDGRDWQGPRVPQFSGKRGMTERDQTSKSESLPWVRTGLSERYYLGCIYFFIFTF